MLKLKKIYSLIKANHKENKKNKINLVFSNYLRNL